MKRLLVALFIVLASPLLVKVSFNHPVNNSAVIYAGRTFYGGTWCDPCTTPNCAPEPGDSPCLNNSTVPDTSSNAISSGAATSLPLFALVAALLLIRLRL